ncbi:hypothetical protein NDU88_002170 [Pleurodeles waltl]|uniref:CCHC-type domain-containing protein n=1 Tax=Pleurodeles waltl TaxID=8319 RepID=A0AAV7P615_PLEWA|nr:hypothetical protein NDU88_002170 [Pleurodeles waltl]
MSRPLNPWFHNTVKLQRKVESNGSTPEFSRKTFTELLVTKMGFTAAEIWCWSRRDEKPFSDFHLECQLVLEVKRMTVLVYNPHVNIQDLTTFLRCHCTMTREPSRNLDSDGIWDGKWTVMVKLKEDPADPDGIHHPPSSFSLGRDSGYLYYPRQPKLCNKCSKPGHTPKDCTVQVCKNCKREGHTARACKEEAPCNLCGAVGHSFKDCPQRAKSYAQAAKVLGERHKRRLPRPAFQSQHPERPRKLGRGKAPGRSKSNLNRALPRPWSHRAQKKKCLPSLRVGQQTTLPNPPLRSRKKEPG